MNNKEVYINGILIELNEKDNPIQLVYSINDLAELKDRQAYSTNIFKAPRTPGNDLACGIPNDPNLIQLQPYRKNTGKVVQGGIEVLPNGIAIITEADKKSISIQILSGLVGFFDIIADKSIRDLDLSAYDHIFNIDNVAESQENTTGYLYPVIDYGGLSLDKREADARQLRPATFRRTIIEKIISEAGYTATGNYQTYPKYINSLVPFTNDKFEHGKTYSDMLAAYKTSARNRGPYVLVQPETNQRVILDDAVATNPQNSWNGTTFTAPIASRYSFSFKYSIQLRNIFFGGSTPEVFTSIRLNGAVVVGNLTTVVNGFGETQDFFDQEITATLDLKAGDTIDINLLQGPGPNRLYGFIYAGAEFKAEIIVEDVVYGSEVQLAATLPEISQANFFKDFLQNFGLIVIPDNYNQELLFINMEDVYANKPVAQDITDKLIDGAEKVSYSFGSYGVNNIGKYKADDAVPVELGRGVMVFDNQTLNANVDLFESVFSASPEVIRLSGVRVSEIKKIEDITKSSEFKIKTQPRILLNATLNSSFRIYDGNTDRTVSVVSTPLFTGLSYSDLFAENYPEVLRMLYRPFIVEKPILLSETDIADIDWTVPVYDRKTANYYYKNSIKYLQGDVSTISLILLP